MKRKSLISSIFAVSLGLGLLAGCGGSQPVEYTMATGGVSGTYYPLGSAMCQVFNEYVADAKFSATASGASVENCNLLNSGEAALAIVQNDMLDYAYNGTEAFAGKKLENVAVIASLYPEIIQLVVDADSGINDITDLPGKKISIGAPGSGVEANAQQIFDMAGVSADDVQVHSLSFSESADNLKEKLIDGFFVTSGIPNASVQNIAESNQFRLISFSEALRGRLIETYPFYSTTEIPPGTYSSQTEAISTVAVKAVLACSKDLPEETVYNITKSLFENAPELASMHAKGRELSVELALDGLSTPLHPGAEKYYKEIGVLQ